MGAREVIAKTIQQWGLRDAADSMAQHAIDQLHANGYVILSPDEVRGIRDEALEEAAREAKSWEQTARKLSRREPDEERSLYHSLAGDTARDIAAAIRSLKGGRDAQ